jgi:hypothetical protein
MEARELTQELLEIDGDPATLTRGPERPPVHADPHTMIPL